MSSINTAILSNPSHPKFIPYIQEAPELVDVTTVTKFMNTVLSNFRKKKEDLPAIKGKAILISIISLLQNPTYNSMFIENGYVHKLPFNEKVYADSIFDLFHTLITQDYDIFDERLAFSFSQQIPFSPLKALVLIAKYGEHLDKISYPWYLLDLLFSCKKNFIRDTAIQYISLLSYLCVKKDNFRSDRSIQSFDSVADLLNHKDPEVIKTAYGALISITRINPKCQNQEYARKIPIQSLISHLQSKDEGLIFDALSFLLVYEIDDDSILQQLVKMKNQRASLVLMKYCENQEKATFLVSNNSWLKNPAQNRLECLKLIYCLLRHKDLQRTLSSSQNFISFLVSASKNTNLNEFILILGILKQIPLSSQKVKELAEKKFFTNIIQSANQCNSEQADRVRYNIFEIVAQYIFINELPVVCRSAVTEIIDNCTLSAEAYRLILQLCKYSQCVKVMKDLKLVAYYEKQLNNKKNKAQAQKFLAAIPKNDDEIEYEYEEDEEGGYSYD